MAGVAVHDLVVLRGRTRAVDDLSFELAPGQVVGLLGPSGCGKTTLMRALVGVQVIASGSVEVFGRSAGSAELRSRIGYVTQAASVYPDLTVGENLGFFGAVLGVSHEDVDRCVGAVGLSEQLHDRVDELSGGQRARVSLAVALLGSPDLLVMDEPTVGLDPLLRRALWQLFHDIADEGKTVLVSSHVMDEAERCDRLLLMREGRLLADDSPTEILRATGTPDIEAAFIQLVGEHR